MYTHSVSSLNEQIKSLLEESFNQVLVEGELSRITFHNSGHIYFTLKDKNSAISCVMFRGNASRLKFRLEEGLKVVINGAVSLYTPRGSYQINCFSIEPSGQGALALAYEQLKGKLSSQGYFASEIKKEFSKFPSKIALVTSATSAALQDMLRVAQSRYRLLEIDIYDVLVQGESASYEIANAIAKADTKGYDAIVVGRGGGSIEDLWAFNEERVADAIFRASTPVVSAVGHEIDWVISDYVADMRSPTPTSAMQMILPDTNELYQYLDSLQTQLTQRVSQILFNKEQEMKHLEKLSQSHSIEKRLQHRGEEIQQTIDSMNQTIGYKLERFQQELELTRVKFPHMIERHLTSAQNQLTNLQKMIESNNPKFRTKVGEAQISQEGKVLDLSLLKVDDLFEAQNSEYTIEAKVLKKEKI